MKTISRAQAGNRCAHINLYNNNERITPPIDRLRIIFAKFNDL